MNVRAASVLRGVVALLVGVVLAVPGALGTAAAAAAPKPIAEYSKWSWFTNTYWIVPQNGIYSVLHTTDPSRFTITRGQTVFHITDYFNGYFLGSVVVKLTRAGATTCHTMLGQVTPSGKVY